MTRLPGLMAAIFHDLVPALGLAVELSRSGELWPRLRRRQLHGSTIMSGSGVMIRVGAAICRTKERREGLPLSTARFGERGKIGLPAVLLPVMRGSASLFLPQADSPSHWGRGDARYKN